MGFDKIKFYIRRYTFVIIVPLFTVGTIIADLRRTRNYKKSLKAQAEGKIALLN